MFKKTAVAATLALAAFHSSAALTLISPFSAADVVATIVGPGIVASDPAASWDASLPRGVSSFSGGSLNVGFNNGVVLTTGNMGCLETTNTLPNCTSSSNTGSFSKVSFNFAVATAGTLSFTYVFASEEYGNTTVNLDFASFVLTGPGGVAVNVATTGLPSAVSGINVSHVGCNALTGSLFIDNSGVDCLTDSGESRQSEFDGLTTVLNATAALGPGTYSFEFRINDAGIGTLGGPNLLGDSALFIQADSFIFTTPGGPDPVPEPATWALAGLGLVAASVLRRRRKAA